MASTDQRNYSIFNRKNYCDRLTNIGEREKKKRDRIYNLEFSSVSFFSLSDGRERKMFAQYSFVLCYERFGLQPKKSLRKAGVRERERGVKTIAKMMLKIQNCDESLFSNKKK